MQKISRLACKLGLLAGVLALGIPLFSMDISDTGSSPLAARYQMRSRSSDFFARSTNNPAAKYSGTVRSSGGKSLPMNRHR